jgi:MSHA biogenesis protein MshK
MNTRFRLVAICALVAAAAAGRVFAGDLRDPMRPPDAPAAARPAPVYSLKLEGVIAGEKRVAIVNGRLVRAGDIVAGARIVDVLANGVRFERGGKIQTLTLASAPANTNVRVARSDEKP